MSFERRCIYQYLCDKSIEKYSDLSNMIIEKM